MWSLSKIGYHYMNEWPKCFYIRIPEIIEILIWSFNYHVNVKYLQNITFIFTKCEHIKKNWYAMKIRKT